MTECPFCKLVREGLPPHTIYEDGTFFVILDRESLAPGHCMIIPRKHVTKIYELDADEYSALFQLARMLAVKLAEVARSQAVGFVAFGSGLPHAHLHLVPHDDPKVLSHPSPKMLSAEQLKAEADRLRPFLAKA